MANKRINDLQARSDADATINIAADDAAQTWRVTGAMLKAFISGITTLGDISYAAASGVATRLAGNTTTTKKVLTQTGTGSVSAAPVWSTPTPANDQVISKTSAYTLVPSSDDTCLADATSTAFTVTLPAASGNGGKKFTIKKIDSTSNIVTIARAGSDTIDGATSALLSLQYESVTLVSDGSAAWYII